MFKNVLILSVVPLLASCGGGGSSSSTNSNQTFSLSTINSTAIGTIYETQLAGSDTFGKNYVGSISIINREQTVIDGVKVTPQDVTTLLNDGIIITNRTGTDNIDSDGNLIFRGNPPGPLCTPLSPDRLPTSVKIGDSGIRSTLKCSDGKILEGSWHTEEDGNGNAKFITSVTEKDHGNVFIAEGDVTYTINHDGNILAFGFETWTDVWKITMKSISVTEPNDYCGKPIQYSGPELPGSSEYLIQFKDGVDVLNEINRLINIYVIEVGTILESSGGFFAMMTDDEMQKLRCEDSINSIAYNSTVSVL